MSSLFVKSLKAVSIVLGCVSAWQQQGRDPWDCHQVSVTLLLALLRARTALLAWAGGRSSARCTLGYVQAEAGREQKCASCCQVLCTGCQRVAERHSLLSTTRKLVFLRMSTLPVPDKRKPVMVSCAG